MFIENKQKQFKL